MAESPAFICLSYLFNEAGFNEKNLVGNFVYFSKNNLSPIQLNLLKVNYTDLELSSYAIQIDQPIEDFIDNFKWAMKTLEKFSKESK